MRPEILLGLVSLMSVPVTASALSADRNQPMNIEADHAELDDRAGVSTYTGAVLVQQGSLKLEAATMTVHTENNHVVRVAAEGSPARYRQRPEQRGDDVIAEAQRMEYISGEQKIILLGDASVQQGGNHFRSDRIVYDIARDLVQAGDATGGQRVRITIEPKPLPPEPAP